MKKTNIDILGEIREYRNSQLRNLGDNSTFVVSVETLGKGQNTKKEIYRLIEEKEIIDSRTGNPKINQETGMVEKEYSEMFYEYDEKPVLIGVRNIDTQGLIVPVGINGENIEKWEVQKEDIEQCLEERNRQLKAIAKQLGLKEEDIENLSEIELAQIVEENELEKEEKDNEEKKEDEPQKIEEEQMKQAGISGMNEVKLDTHIDTKGNTLGKELKLDGYSKLMVVHSYKLAELTDQNGEKGKANKVKFALIAQKEDGTYETIPETKLKLYRGENTEVTEINDKDEAVIRREDCIFEVPGTNTKMVVNQKGPYGRPDVYLAKTTRTNEGNVAEKLQDQYDGTIRQDVEVRELFNKNKGIDQPDKMHEEAKEHQEAGCEEMEIDEVNGDRNDGHIHFNPEIEEQEKAIEEIMERGNVSREEAEYKLADQLENSKEDVSLEDAKENAIEEIEQEYRGGNSRKR